MIRLDNVSKQAGHQILFIEASAALQRGEKVGLVGPNGAVPLRPKAFDVLLHLARNRDRVISKDELMEAIWPNVFVTRHAPDEATYFPSWRNDEGQYIVLGVPVGTFEVTAQDDVGVTATVSGEIVDLASSVTVDVTLPATGVVSGAVRNADGTPAAGAEVLVTHRRFPVFASINFELHRPADSFDQ